MSPVQALVRYVSRRAPIPSGWLAARGRAPSGGIREEQSTDAGTLADPPVVAVIRLRIAVGGGAKGRGRSGWSPRDPDQPLGDVMRLALQPWLAHAVPPSRLTTCSNPNGPAPSLPRPLRYAGGSQLLRAGPPASPHRYSAPRG